jgi:hypothetical protein
MIRRLAMKNLSEYEQWLLTEYIPIRGGEEPPAAPVVPAEPAAEPAAELADTTEVDPIQMEAMLDMLGEKPAEPVVPAEPVAPVEKPPEPVKPTEPVKPPESPKETELDAALRRENDLRTLLNDMARGGVAPVSPAPAVAPAAPVSSPAAPLPSAVQEHDKYSSLIKILGPDAVKAFSDKMKEDVQFMTKEQLGDLIDHPELIIPALNQARRQSAEEVMAVIPTIVAGMVESYYTTVRTANEFYEKNTDLAPYRDFTRLVFQQTQAANQDKDMKAVLDLTAVEARKRLHLQAPVAAPASPPKGPNFPAIKTRTARATPTTRESAPTEKTQQDYMAETLTNF